MTGDVTKAVDKVGKPAVREYLLTLTKGSVAVISFGWTLLEIYERFIGF